ncbi:MAG: hybrid sensor histidine kinase/response regulator [Deltaproteobacteria bacterium]|nr:hybrid sensor histidine kinase/response regulator [Deltaproteobacteria bacterium]
MIEDDELRNIFKLESAEHIQRLEEDFLRLETEPENAAVLEEAFREAHSLKGAARMLGLTGVETLSHRIEDVLGTAKKGSVPLSSEIIDRLYKGLDEIRNLVKEAVTGEPSGVIVSHALEQLKIIPESGVQSSEANEDNSKFQNPKSKIEEPEGPALHSETREPAFGDFRIDTIRVETNKLDKLMSQTGELNVTKLRIAQRLEDINDVLILWENISRKLPKSVTEDKPIIERFGVLLNTLRNALYEDSSRLDLVTAELEDSISRIRLLPLSTIFNLFQRMVRDLAKDKAKEVRLVIEGGETAADKRIIEEIKDPLMHMVRNAVDHGIEMPDERVRKNKPRTGTITLKAYQTPANVVIEVSDDGQGLDIEAIKRAALKRKTMNENEISAMSPSQIQSLIFVSGVSTSAFVSDVSGRGVGLDVVRANVERLKGTIHIESSPDKSCTIKIQLPLTLATSKVMIVTVNNMKYAVPVEHIQTTCLINRKNVFTIEGRKTIVFDKLPVPVVDLSDLLELRGTNPVFNGHIPKSETLPCIIISTGDDKLGFFVNELLDEQEVVLKQYSSILKRARNISGSTILGTGEVCMVLNPYDLIKSAKKKKAPTAEEKPVKEAETGKSILVAEDSITVRTQMKRILEGAGYEVTVAVDGLEAYNKLGGRPFDALVSDITMPNMDGLALTERIRQNKKYKEMPVILVTSLASDEDRQRGMDAGANAYITKPSFDQKVLLDTLRRLI